MILAQQQDSTASSKRESSLTGLETIPERVHQAYDEYGQPIVMDEEYRKNLARERWHWAFTKIVQVRPFL